MTNGSVKYVSLFSILLLGFASGVRAQTWTNVHAVTDTATLLQSVYFTDANTGYVAGNNGVIRKTINGGTSWVAESISVSIPSLFTLESLNSIRFVNATTGFAVGSGLSPLLKTSNSGALWADPSGGTAPTNLKSVYFVDANVGYICGLSGVISKTIDGGAHWTAQTSNSTQNLTSVYFMDANVGYVVGAGALNTKGGTFLKTINGGTTWTQFVVDSVNTTNFILNGVYFTDANTGYIACGSNGVVYKTVNGGTTWTQQPTTGSLYGLLSITFTDANTGYVVGGNGVIYKTVNAGGAWTAMTSSTTQQLNGIAFSGGVGYAVGAKGTILKVGTPSPIFGTNAKFSGSNFELSKNGNLMYDLAHQSHVLARLYDSRGKQSLQILDADQNAGSHTLTLPAAKSSAGVQILDFQTDGVHKAIEVKRN